MTNGVYDSICCGGHSKKNEGNLLSSQMTVMCVIGENIGGVYVFTTYFF